MIIGCQTNLFFVLFCTNNLRFLMNLKKWWQIFYLCLLTYCILIACAKQISPTGGPRDETPPEVLEVSPPHLSTNFTSEIIEIEFDEYIKLNNPNEQIVI